MKYDAQAQRWFITQFSVTGGPPYYECIAVSSGPDFIGSTWACYAYPGCYSVRTFGCSS